MENKEMSGQDGTKSAKTGYLAGISIFWLIVGGLMLFFGAAAILQRVGVWSEVDAENAGDAVIILLGIAAVVHALRGRSKFTETAGI